MVVGIVIFAGILAFIGEYYVISMNAGVNYARTHFEEFPMLYIKGTKYSIASIWMKIFSAVSLIFEIVVFIIIWRVIDILNAAFVTGRMVIVNCIIVLCFALTFQVCAWIKFRKGLYKMIEYLIEQHPEAVNNESYVVIKIKKVLRDNDESCNDRAIKRAFKKYRKRHALP